MAGNLTIGMMERTAFMQQGQVDWVAFGNSLHSASPAIMQRLAAAGVQPVTHGAGLALATRFQLGENGSRRVDEALSQLKQYHCFENVLWFGFGHKSFVRLLVDSQLGVNCIALCTCLGEAHQPATAAKILNALWKVEGFLEQYRPSRSQFENLVGACSGVLIGASFHQVMKTFAGRHISSEYTQTTSASMDFAKALGAIFQVSKGTRHNVDIIGGIHVAFLGALAYWLLDLSIWIEDEDSSIMFQSAPQCEIAQIKMKYEDPAQRKLRSCK